MRRLNGARRTRSASRTCNAHQIECDEHCFAPRSREREVRRVRDSPSDGAIHEYRRDGIEDRALEPVAQSGDALRLRCEICESEFGGLTEANDPGNVFGTGATITFVMATVKLWNERRAGAFVESTDTLWAIDFVRGDAEQIHAELIHAERELSCRLHCVAVKINVSFGGDAADFSNRLNCSDFVIRVHHADKDCFGTQCAANFVGIDYPCASDRNIGDFNALLFERLTRIENRMMFDRARDDVLAAASGLRRDGGD